MSSPTIPDLSVATIANDSDQMLMRQPAGALGTDKSVTVSKVRNINVAGLPTLSSPTTAQDSDLFMIARSGTNYQIRHDQVSFRSGTKMWFYHNVFTEIGGWSLVTTSDNLLAVKGGSEYLTGGQLAGTWQQVGHGLTIAEIPNHQHYTQTGNTQSNSHSNYLYGARYPGGTNPTYSTKAGLGIVGGTGDNSTHNAYGGVEDHNHGDTWRPRANVGIICQKN